MARLIFSKENEQNNNDQPSAIDVNDNTSSNVVIMTADDGKTMTERSTVIGSKVTSATSATVEQDYANEYEFCSQLSHHRDLTGPADKATEVLVSESLVARLASKFNAVVVSENNSVGKENFCSSPREAHSAEKPINARSSSVQKTIKFFEEDLTNKNSSSSPPSPSSDTLPAVIRIDRAAYKNLGTKRSESTSHLTEIVDRDDDVDVDKNHVLSMSVVVDVSMQKLKMASDTSDNLNTRSKPAVHPKPQSLLRKISTEKKVRVERENLTGIESLPCKSTIVSNVAEKLYHAPKISSKKDQNLSVLKDKRLSIAKDFSLESVLNNDMVMKWTSMEIEKGERANDGSDGDTDDGGNRCSTAVCDNKVSNNSFLHKYLEQCLEMDKSTAKEEFVIGEAENDLYVEKRLSVPRENVKNSSTLHDSLVRTFNDSQHSKWTNEGDYEDLTYGGTLMVMNDELAVASEHANTNYYQYLDSEESSLSNVYSDVIYAQLTTGNRDLDDIENYETISAESYGNSPTDKKCVTNVFARDANGADSMHSSSESSLEQANSLYDLKPLSELSSIAATSVFSSSNDRFPGKLDGAHVSATDLRSVSRSISDEDEGADYCDSDNDFLSYRNRSNSNKSKYFKKKRKLKFPVYRKEYPQMNQDYDNSETFIDDFDDSSSDQESFEMNGHEQPVRPSNKTSISNLTQSQNIYGFVEKARKTVRKSWSSLNQIRKMSVSNIASKNQDSPETRAKSVSVGEFNFKNALSSGNVGSVRWTSFKSRLKPKYSTVSSSTSIFYLPPEDLMFSKTQENVTKKQNASSKNRRRTTCIELRPTARPTSPPPPPPVDKSKMNGANSVSSLSIYSDPSTRSSNSGSEINSELNSSRSSDLHLRFADEPLYQFYAESIAQLSTNDSLNVLTDSDGYEEIASTASRPSAMELITPSPNGHGQHRSLWCEVPEVKNSGILETLSPDKKKLQEAIFEIITSEASYYKSLSVLDKIFANSPSFKNESVLSKNDWKILFGNVTAVRKCSEKLLAALEKCWQDSILLTGLCNVIYEHANDHFQVYVKYCSNQIYIDRTLKKLREQNSKFVDIINQLEANPACQSLNLPSFLMLPMQRITRMPLLVDAVLSKMDPIIDGDEYKTYQITLATLNKIVRDCNESARKLERYEEMLLLSQQLEFTRKDVKLYTIASSSRWLIRSGPMEYINPQDTKLTLTKKLTKHTTKLYFFLFNDILIVAKKKNDAPTYAVLDYCARNVVQMSLLDDSGVVLPALSSANYRYLLMLTILDNHEGKTVEMILNCDSDSTRQRWLEATSSHLTSDNPDEKLYEKWDCPQVSAIHSYTAVQPDELSLHAGDVVKVLKKTTDGWYHGERIRDGTTGWFPGNYTVEIASQHTRAKNLKLRHRLLTLSASYLQNQYQKKT